ncbi:MAG: ATPase domain-containing protein [Candidatus Altiarchaeota archaeon]|nr:ATPase domain-containing protein [Candidatus Altiarchaeota archaeon]
MDRATTGIKGLDKLIGGGIPRNHSVLLTGSCGTGKTILSLQFLHQGAVAREPGLYVTFEESRDKILSQACEFGWDLEKLEREGLLEVYVVETFDMEDVLESIKEKVRKLKARRLVIDSLTVMLEHGVVYHSRISKEMSAVSGEKRVFKFPEEGHNITRKDIYFVVKEINKLNTTSLLISEVAEKSEYLSRDTISEFACDGVILLRTSELGGEIERLLSVRKMRGTEVQITLSPMKFTKDGIIVE